jgi:hypothetical protein
MLFLKFGLRNVGRASRRAVRAMLKGIGRPRPDFDHPYLRGTLAVLWGIIGLGGLWAWTAGRSELGTYIGQMIGPRPMTESFASNFSLAWSLVCDAAIALFVIGLAWAFRRINRRHANDKAPPQGPPRHGDRQ